MKLVNLIEVSDYRVEEWLCKSIPELTKYQKECIRNNEIIRFAPFKFYKRGEKIKNFWVRLSVIPFPFVWLVLFIGIPFNFLFTGKWGYGKVEWFAKWASAIGVY